MSYSIVLAEDQSLIRDSLKTLISSHDDLDVCGTACNGHEALDLCRTLHPDIALPDVRMPNMSGLEVAAALRQEELECRIVLLTTFEEEQVFTEALSLGVEGVFLKDIQPDVFASALLCIARGLQDRTQIAVYAIRNRLIEDLD